MTRPEMPNLINIGFDREEWTSNPYFYATLKTPSLPYAISFGQITQSECENEDVDFTAAVTAFVKSRQIVAQDLGMLVDLDVNAEHQLANLTRDKKLCDTDDCDQCG